MSWVLLIVSASCAITLCFQGDYMATWHSLATGLIIGTIIWFFTVHLPERKLRATIVNNLKRAYHDFKYDTTTLLLQACGSSAGGADVKKLCDFKEFRAFFKGQNWYDALNGVQSEKEILNDLIVEFDVFLDNFRYAMSRLEIRSDRVHTYYRVFKENIYHLKHASSYAGDPTKYLGEFLYEKLASHCRFRGPQEYDIFEKEILSEMMKQ